MAALFLLQTLVGAAVAALPRRPRQLLRLRPGRRSSRTTWRAPGTCSWRIFWVATSFLAAGIFLAPMIAGREPRRQGRLAYGAARRARGRRRSAALIGELPRHPRRARAAVRTGSGMQGFEYLDLGAALAGAADRRPVRLGVHAVPRAARRGCAASTRATCRGCSSSPRWRSRRSTRSGCSPSTGDNFTDHRLLALLGRAPVGRGLPRAVHHGDGRLHVRAARRGARARRADRRSTSTSSCTRSAASSARCTTCTSPASRPSTWRSGAFFSAAEVIPLTFLTVEAWSVPAARRRARSRRRRRRSRTAGR